MSIAIVDYGTGNYLSLLSAFERLGIKCLITSCPEEISKAAYVLLPGVGHASAACNKLNQDEIADCIKCLKAPVLGICLGMQLLFEETDEGGEKCLGIFTGQIKKFTANKRLPHMGWNVIRQTRSNPLLKSCDGESFYFAHSYIYADSQAPNSLATSCYQEETFSSVYNLDNYWAVQFHPERSGIVGERLLKNFLEIGI